MHVAHLKVLDHNSLYSVLKMIITFYTTGKVTVEETFWGLSFISKDT